MTIEEAILHAEEVAEDCERYENQEVCESRTWKSRKACAEQHHQLVEWLKELKERRKLPEVILCKDCDNLKSDEYHHWCKSHGGFFNPEKDFCSRAERR